MNVAKERALVWWTILVLLGAFWALVCFMVVPKCVLAQVQSIDITFNHGNEPDLKGFRLYYGNTSRVYGISYWIPLSDYVAPPGWMTVPVPLVPGGYFLTATAVDLADNESEYSNEVTLAIPDTPPSPCQGFAARIPIP